MYVRVRACVCVPPPTKTTPHVRTRATQEGSRDALHVLFAAGADITIPRKDGMTPDRIARRCGNQGLLRSLKHLRKPEKKWTLPVL